jgi:hypothetical protein
MIDPSGFTKEGWSEVDREQAERQLKSIVERSHHLSPDGNMPITIHASAVPGTEYSKPSEEIINTYKRQIRDYEGREATKDDLKKLDESQIIAINQETGQLVPIKREERYYPEQGRKIIKIPEEEIDTVNNTEWVNSITNLAFYKKEADEILRNAQPELMPLFEKIEKKQEITKEDMGLYSNAIQNLQRADLFLGNIEASFRNIYNKAYKYGDENTRKVLDKISEEWKGAIKERYEISKQKEATPLDSLQFIVKKSQLIDDTLNKVRQIKYPDVYKKVEDFAVGKSAETLGNTAFEAYKNYGNKAPIISIENLYPGMAFSKSKEMENLVKAAREKFVEKAKKSGFSESQAASAAEKLIGVTWDVGHLNMLRKAGYNEAEIVKETEKIAKLVKHVHLTDNFGFTDSHLPPGMGNVPIKDILKELEAAGFKGKKVIEAGGFVQHFKVSPASYILEALGSPLYSMMAQPYWNQVTATYGKYFAFPSAYFPEQHMSIYGSGFSSLPQELGGQVPGKQSRLTGTPNE